MNHEIHSRTDTATATASQPPLLVMQAIEKSFPGVKALRGVNLTLQRGEVLALLGENGAGKSTLIKMLGGAHLPDSGSIHLAGEELRLTGPADAIRAGLGVIYQEFNLIPQLSAWENIFLGRESSSGFLNRRHERQRAKDLFERIGIAIPLDAPCGTLSVAQQQIVEIAKALSQNVRVLVMDEPSAALSPPEVGHLFQIIRDLRSSGIGVIYISHRLDEIVAIADRVVVLRDGANVGEAPIGQLSRKQMIEMMVGRELQNEYPQHTHQPGKVRLSVRNLTRAPAVQDVSFELHSGEILGLTGLVGAGRTELARLLFGADQSDSGSLSLNGSPLRLRSPQDAIQAGICLLTEDRKHQGLILNASVRSNFGLPNLNRYSRFGFVSDRQERSAFQTYVQQLQIKIPNQEQLARNLSGGNQQKVVLAKWLERHADVLIFDEPTRGIDVGARFEIYLLMHELAKQGKAILMISSELPEILGVSTRILVMHAGRITGEIPNARNATQAQVMEFAVA